MVSVLADGRFTLLHAGHVAYLQAAQLLGDKLTVRISPDTPRACDQKTSAVVVAALRGVDAVIADQRSLADVILAEKPDILAKGEDWRDRLPADVMAACEAVGCLVAYVSAEPRMSSSDILREWAKAEAAAGLDELERHMASQPDTMPEPERWRAGGDWAARYAPQREAHHASLIAGLLGPGAAVVDVGCGDGALVVALRERGVEAYGIDPATCGGRIEEQLGGQYDFVVSREVLEHLSVRQLMAHVRHLVRVCHEGGRIYLTSRFHSRRAVIGCEAETPSDDPTHITCMPQAWLRSVLVAWGCVREPEWEAVLDWQHKGRVLVYRKIAPRARQDAPGTTSAAPVFVGATHA